VKRISSVAYQALRDALPVVFWYKRPFESFLRTALRSNPELLAPLDFGLTKREIADALIDRLVAAEARYQDLTLELMQELSQMTQFPDIEQLDSADRELRLKNAKDAVAGLKALMELYSEAVQAKQDLIRQQEANAAAAEDAKHFADELEQIKADFMALHAAQDAQQRGRDFEGLLNRVFDLYDMEPHLAYVAGTDQIDGSIRFDTDDYIMEAKWRTDPSPRSDGDVFAQKVGRKGKNALGLFVSVNGFASTFIEEFSKATPFITLEGSDLFAVLDGRVRLDDLIRAKKRHANDTGSCYCPVSEAVRGDNP
jgi:hypothetical protein